MPARPIAALCATSSVLVLAQCLLPLTGNTVEREVVGQEFGFSEMTRQDIPGVFTTRKALQGVFDLQITKMVGNE